MNMQPIDGARDAQMQTVETSATMTRRETALSVERTGEAQSKTDQAGGKNKKKDKDNKSENADVTAIVKQADQYFQAKGVNLHFKVSDNNQAVQVEMVEDGTEKVICKIPSDDIVKLRDSMKRMAKGVKDVAV
ncbi:hypothetical protein JCM15519_29390 [Fundidesulfovibrio butyratiphilus]